MKKVIYLTGFLGVLLWLNACRPGVDHEALKKELLSLHQTQINAHLNKDIDFFTRNLAPDYWQVSRGEIIFPQKNEITKRFTDYLNNTRFSTYQDLQDPMVKISEDGSMAWVIVQVKISGEQTQPDGSDRALDFTCALITLYNRVNGQWIRQGEVSTFR